MKNAQKIMTEHVVTIEANASIEKAHALFAQHQIRHLPVLQGSDCVGVLSSSDLKGTLNLQLPVKDFMNAVPVTITPQTSVAIAAGLMRKEKVSSLLVVEGQRLVGIVTSHDLLGLLEHPSSSPSFAEQVRQWTEMTPMREILEALNNSGI